MNNRRDFIKKSALALAAITATSAIGNTLTAAEFLEEETILPDEGTYAKEALPYAYDALEPHIDKLTMEIHHSKHYYGYVTNLNKAIGELDSSILGEKKSLNNMFDKMAKLPVAIRNNAGGYYNHFLFWSLMNPPKGGANTINEPKGKLADAIKTTFGSFDEFKKQFADAGMKRFGSGWAWLVKTKEGKLVITSTPNQDNPLMKLDSVEVKGRPILALDVWEHAYYLKNQNRRADYIASWWNVVNWETAENLYSAS